MLDYTLPLFDRFICLGGDCPDTCCKDWNIRIDAATRSRWEAIADPALQEKLLGMISTRETPGGAEEVIQHAAGNNTCPLLDAAGLCSLQTAMGADYLPEVCQRFPRERIGSAITRITTLSLACPESIRLMLDSDEVLYLPTQNLESSLAQDETLIPRLLTNWLAHVLRVEKYGPGVRLLYIAETLLDIIHRGNDGSLSLDFLQGLNKGSKQGLYDASLKNKHRAWAEPFDEAVGAYWRGIATLAGLSKNETLTSRVKDEELYTLLTSDTLHPKRDNIEIAKRMVRKAESLQTSLTALQPQRLRYQQQLFLNHGFPYDPVQDNYVATFLEATLPFAFVHLLLYLQTEDGGAITRAQLADAILMAERILGHSVLSIYQQLNDKPSLLRLDRFYPWILATA